MTIGGRRRPVSRPSRRRCFLASSLVEPLTERTSSAPVRLAHVHHGVRRVVRAGSVGAVPGRTPAALAPPPPAAAAGVAVGVGRPGVAVAAVVGRSLGRGRVRLGVRPVPAGAALGGPAAAAAGGRPPALALAAVGAAASAGCAGGAARAGCGLPGRRASWPGSLSCDSGAPSVPSAAVSWSPVRPRVRLERRLRRRPVPVPSSSSPAPSPLPGRGPRIPPGPRIRPGLRFPADPRYPAGPEARTRTSPRTRDAPRAAGTPPAAAGTPPRAPPGPGLCRRHQGRLSCCHVILCRAARCRASGQSPVRLPGARYRAPHGSSLST